jgi:predicted XRE-type DNA-binding protein
MAMPSKIEDSILLELITKGLSQKQIAEYFGVRPSRAL